MQELYTRIAFSSGHNPDIMSNNNRHTRPGSACRLGKKVNSSPVTQDLEIFYPRDQSFYMNVMLFCQ